MSDMKNKMKKAWLPLALLLVGAILLGTAGIGGASAALRGYSEEYKTRVDTKDIGVSLKENGNTIARRDYDSKKADGSWNTEAGTLLEDLPEELVLGTSYDEKVAVTNSGNINEFVRVTVVRYFTDDKGNKLPELSPELIEVGFVNPSDWVEDEGSRTDERTVFYYSHLLKKGETSKDLMESITINKEMQDIISQTREGDTVTTSYDYDGVTLVIEVKADAVQEHNAEDAILSAWGVEVSVSGETLKLK